MMKYVLVDAISTFRQRYAVAVPDELSDEKAKEWAMDTVTCEDAEEFSQLWLGETISSTKVMGKEELLEQFDEDNDYLRQWSDDMKLRCVCVINEDGDIVSGKASWKSEQEIDYGIKDTSSTNGC
jgi:hypothetical protein